MKNPFIYAFLLTLFICQSTFGQTFKTSFFNANSDYHYFLFADKDFYYFQTVETEIAKVSKQTCKQASRFKLEFENPEERLYKLTHNSKDILMISETRDIKIYKTTHYNFYLFDINGKRLKHMSIDCNENGMSLGLKIRQEDKKLYLVDSKRSDNKAAYAYDFGLNELEDKTYVEDFESLLAELEGSFKFLMDENFNDAFRQFDIDANSSPTETKFNSRYDSTYLANYILRYYLKGGTYGRFDHKIEQLTISDGKRSLKTTFELGQGKTIIELCDKQLIDGKLLVYGKYIEDGNPSKPMYGIFSCVFNSSLEQEGQIRYQELESVSNSKTVTEYKHFVGLALAKLADPNKIFETKDGRTIAIYQKVTYSYSDHIYVLNITPNGEIIINTIGNKFEDGDFKVWNREMFQVQLLNNKLHFLFYEQAVYLNKPVNDVKLSPGSLGRKNNVIVYCTYNYEQDEFSVKKVAINLKDVKELPSFNKSDFSFDPYSSSYNWYLIGKDKEDHASGVFILNFTP